MGRKWTPGSLVGDATSAYAANLAVSPGLAAAMVCVAVTMACSGALAGYVNYNISPDTSAFAYRDGNATTFQAFGNAVFGPSSRYETVVVTSPTGLNVLDKRVLQALFQVDAAVRNLTITAPVTDSGASAGSNIAPGSSVGYEEVCYELFAGKPCSILSVLQYWPSEAAMLADASIGTTIGRCANNTVGIPCTDSTGQNIESAYVLGKGYAMSESNVTSVPALFATYLVKPASDDPDAPAPDGLPEAILVQWERAFVQTVLASQALLPPGFKIATEASSSLVDEINREMDADITVIAVSYMAMGAFVACTIGAVACCSKPTGSRFALSNSVLLSTICALVTAGGVVLSSGVVLNPIVFQTLPFLLLALGVDSAYQIVDAYHREQQGWGGSQSGVASSARFAVAAVATGSLHTGLCCDPRRIAEIAPCCGARDQHSRGCPCPCVGSAGGGYDSAPLVSAPRTGGKGARRGYGGDGEEVGGAAAGVYGAVGLVEEAFLALEGHASTSPKLTAQMITAIAAGDTGALQRSAESASGTFASIVSGKSRGSYGATASTAPRSAALSETKGHAVRAVALALAMKEAGPSLVLATLVQCVAFGAAATIPFQAMDEICTFAAVGVAFNLFFQLCLFLPLFTLDLRRQGSGLLDCFCCFDRSCTLVRGGSPSASRGGKQTVSRGGGDETVVPESDIRAGLSACLTPVYTALATSRLLQAAVIATGIGAVIASAATIAHTPVEFKQEDLLPRGSYVLDYFAAQEAYLGLGPPLYLVFNTSGFELEQNTQGVAGAVEYLRAQPNIEGNTVFDPVGDLEWTRRVCPSSWNEDASYAENMHRFLYSPCEDTCGAFPAFKCDPLPQPEAGCPPSLLGEGCTPGGALDAPWELCSFALCEIRSVHRNNVAFYNVTDVPTGRTERDIKAVRVQTYFTPLSEMDEFIAAMQTAWRVAAMSNVSTTIVDSLFIPFYEQYVVIAALTGQLFALAFGVLVALHLLFELSWRSSLVLVVIVASTMTLAGGALTWTGAGLNSTTAINLVAGTGIAIELSIHLLRFIQSRRAALAIDEACASSGDSRAAQTPYGRLAARVVAGAVDSGVTTLTGITLTKLLGLAVLTAAQSRLTRVDFVGVLVPVVAFGGLFTLLVLPALLLALPWLIEPHADIADPAAAKETELFDEYNDE